jgi:hypothetical protein
MLRALPLWYHGCMEILTIEQAAKEINRHENTLRQHCQRGYLGRKHGRDWVITRAELDRFKRDRRNPGRPPKSQ